MDTKIRLVGLGFFSFFLFALCCSTAPPAEAAIVNLNLTTVGSSGVINDAIFEQIDPQSTGTGVIDSFVQQSPQGNGTTSHAYNTTENNVLDNKSADNFNHSIELGQVPIVARVGTPYREFLLDVNENSGGGDEFISLDEVQVFVGGTANASFNTFVAGVLTHNGTLVYRMDAGGDSWVALDATLNSGSGSGDMLLLIPNSAFAGFSSTDVVTLYSAFGNQGVDPTGYTGLFGGGGGFEEWAVRDIPEPSTALLGLAGLAGLMAVRRRRS